MHIILEGVCSIKPYKAALHLFGMGQGWGGSRCGVRKKEKMREERE